MSEKPAEPLVHLLERRTFEAACGASGVLAYTDPLFVTCLKCRAVIAKATTQQPNRKD